MQFKPNKTAFLYYKYAVSFIVLLFFSAIISAAVFIFAPQFFILTIGILILILILIFIQRFVQYKKTFYIFEKDRLVMKGGGIFSNYETELTLKNITQVWMTLPFIENKLFQTGSIFVRAAGSAGDEIYLDSIDIPDKKYAEIQRLMKQSGFKLSRNNLLQLEKPHPLGIFFEIFSQFISILFVGFFVVISFIPSLFTESFLLAFAGLFLIAIFLTAKFVLRFLDLKLREYSLYHDVIEYKEGFLTKNYSVIPAENLSDSKINQTIIDRIFGLYDVTISSQGSENNISFTNMVNGEKFKRNLDSVIKAYDPLVQTAATKAKKTAPKKSSASVQYAYIQGNRLFAPLILFFIILILIAIIAIPLFVLFTEMSYILVIGLFLLALFIMAIVSPITLAIKKYATTYAISSNFFAETFSFISKKHKEFSLDKVTLLIVKRNPFDWFFNTATVSIRSIGSNEEISYQHISSAVLKKVLDTYGFSKKYDKTIFSQFSFLHMLKCNFPLTIIASLVFIISFFVHILLPLVLLIILAGIFAYRIFYYRRSFMKYSTDHVLFNRGLVFQEQYFAKYIHIKDATSLQYPFATLGKFTVSAAGEIVQQTDKQKMVVSNGFSIRYISNVFDQHDYLDCRLGMKSQKVIAERPRVFANSIVPLFIVSILILPLLIVLPFLFGFLFWRNKKFQYLLQEDRVFKISGILYKKKETILHDRIDHLNSSEGLLNKVFKNGTVLVFTAGSSSPELVIQNIPKYKEFYNILEKNYKS